jgi:hypothetical protein
MMINWKRFGRKWSWPNFKYYPGIRLEGVGKSTKNLNKDSRSPGHPEYEVELLTTRPRSSV